MLDSVHMNYIRLIRNPVSLRAAFGGLALTACAPEPCRAYLCRFRQVDTRVWNPPALSQGLRTGGNLCVKYHVSPQNKLGQDSSPPHSPSKEKKIELHSKWNSSLCTCLCECS